MEEFKSLGTILTKRNSIQEEIKIKMKSRNACYYLVQNLLSCNFLFKKVKTEIWPEGV